MWTAELRVLFRRTRVRVLLGVLAAVPVLLVVVVYVQGAPPAGQGPSFLDQVAGNGVFAALAGLAVTLPFFLPLAVSVVAGDAIAGEASLGTLRYLLVRPSGRTRLLASKGLAIAVFCVVAALVVAVAGLLAGAVFFPLGPVTSLSGTRLSLADGIGRTLLASLVVGASLCGLGAVGLFASTLTDAPMAAMAATVGAAVLSAILDSVSEVAFLHPWLLTHDWLRFGDLLRTPVQWHGVLADLLLQAGYVAVFTSAAWARFSTADVRS